MIKIFMKETKATKKIVLAEVFKIIPPCNSAVDFGCATRTWLFTNY